MINFRMIAESIPALNSLSKDQKLQLVGELWQDIFEDDRDIPLSDAVKSALDERMEEYRRDPSQAVTWEEARQRIRDSRH